MQPAHPVHDTEDLRILSSDLLNILEHRKNTPDHPDLAHVLSSGTDWNTRAPALEADVRSMLPPGTRFYLTAPCGAIGDLPPDDAPKYVRPFEAFVAENDAIVECRLIIWRA